MKSDFKLWDQLLKRYVNQEGRVDYRAWQTEHPSQLSQWLDQLSDVNVSSLDINQQLAFWINLYNALTIQQILKAYPIDSILPKIFGFPNWLALFWFFKRPIYQLNHHRYSLSDIEHDILRKQFNDPRIHFAIVCASVGCPHLRAEAYFPEQVQQQLSEDTSRFINNPTKVCYDVQENILYLSQIFGWYRQDFLQVSPSLPHYIQSYLDDSTSFSSSVSIKYCPYDWNLNQRIS